MQPGDNDPVFQLTNAIALLIINDEYHNDDARHIIWAAREAALDCETPSAERAASEDIQNWLRDLLDTHIEALTTRRPDNTLTMMVHNLISIAIAHIDYPELVEELMRDVTYLP